MEILKLCSGKGPTDGMPPILLVLGFAVSAAVSFGALRLLLRIVRKGRLCWFSWYMFAVGALVCCRQLYLLVNK